MAIYASFQKQATNPNLYQIGVPTGILLDGATYGAQAVTDIIVGSACYLVDNNAGLNTTVTQIKTGTQQVAGVVVRSQSTSISWNQAQYGFGNIIPRGQNVTILTRGSIPVLLALALDAGNYPLAGSAIYAMPDGTWQSQIVGAVAPINGNITNFRIKQVPTGWVANSIVLITNTQNIGA